MRKFVPTILFLALFAFAAMSDPTFTPPIRPDPGLTPGATLNVTAKDVCVKGYSAKVRNVSSKTKGLVYSEYHIPSTRKKGEYEIDHLISLELGGSNDITNLWPQSYQTTPWNAHVKDALEDRLHADVCNGKMKLADAQKAIRTDWIAAWKKEFGKDSP